MTAAAQSASSILVSWTASTDNVAVTGYGVYRGAALVGSPATTSFTDIGLTDNTTYSYTVKAKDAAGNMSNASTAATATTPDATPPSVPASVAAVAQSNSSILVTWNASTDNVGVTGYEVYQGATLVDSPAATSYTANGLTPSTTYGYTIKAKDAAGNISLASAAATATTLSADSGTPVDYQAETATLFGLTSGGTYVQEAVGTGSYIEWAVTPLAAGPHDLIIRYSLGTGTDRPMEIKVNGAVVAASYSMPRLEAMTDWGIYADSSPLRVTLNAGVNTVRATGIGSGSPRLDYLRVVPIAIANPDANNNGMPDAWETTCFGGTTNPAGAADYDWDHDGQDNLHEYLAGTDPTNPADVFKITSAVRESSGNMVLQWPSVTGKSYQIQTAPDLSGNFQDTADAPVSGTGGIVTKSVTVGPAPAGFYRIRVLP